MFKLMTKKYLYAISAILIITVAAIVCALYHCDENKSCQETVDHENLMKAWNYLRAQIVEFPFGNLVREHPDSNVCWLNDAWLAAKALAKLYPMESQNLTKGLGYFNFTVHEHLCIIFGDTENFAGPFGMPLHPKVYGNYSSTDGEIYQINANVPDREIFMFNFADYADLLAEAVMFEHYTGHDWKAKKLYDQLRETWNGTGLVDKIAREGGESEPPHFDTYKLALACLAAQLMGDESFANQMMYAIMKNQYAQPGKHQWGFITWYSKLGEPLNPEIPTNVETTTLCLIAVSPFIISSYSTSNIKVGLYYYVWYDGKKNENVIDDPVIGWQNYKSQDIELIKKHMYWFKELDVDFLIVSWWGINSFEDSATKILFSTVKQEKAPIELVIMVEPFNSTPGKCTSGIYNFTTIYNYINDNYVTPYNNIYMRLNERPLLCFFNNDNMTKNGQIPLDDEFEVRIVGHEPYVDWVYCSVDANRWAEHWGWSKQPLCVDGEINVLSRFDDRACGDRPNHTVIDPDCSEGLYDEQWGKAINLAREGKVNLIMITSWNEFAERTQIEPHIDMNGNYVLSLYCETKYYINQIKSLGRP